MDTSQERMRILEMIESGRISAEQGLLLLQALNEPEAEESAPDFDDTGFTEEDFREAMADDDAIPAPGGAAAPTWMAPQPAHTESGAMIIDQASQAPPEWGSLSERAAQWKRLWAIPMGLGIFVTLGGSALAYAALALHGGAISLQFLCATLPILLGLLVMLLAWGLHAWPWLHLRVQQPPGEWPQTIRISLPLPVEIAGWFLRVFGGFIPGLQDQPVDEILQMVHQTTVTGVPITVEVDEGDGEKVEIYIG